GARGRGLGGADGERGGGFRGLRGDGRVAAQGGGGGVGHGAPGGGGVGVGREGVGVRGGAVGLELWEGLVLGDGRGPGGGVDVGAASGLVAGPIDADGALVYGPFRPRLMSERFTDVGHVDFRHVIPCHARQRETLAQPPLLDGVFEARLQDRVLRQLAHVYGTELVDLSCDRVLLDQRLLGESELQWIVGGQAHVQAAAEVLQERISFVGQEQCIIGQRTHRDTNLLQIEDILQQRHLAKQQTVADAVTAQHSCRQMLGVTGLTTMRP
ncbi:hypothetical protein Tdes44962_MAKER01222, partial [Teratosphaeria destructans]